MKLVERTLLKSFAQHRMLKQESTPAQLEQDDQEVENILTPVNSVGLCLTQTIYYRDHAVFAAILFELKIIISIAEK